MGRSRNPLLTGYALAVYAFLFAPIAVLIIFSFNDSKSLFVWRGFTLKWYPQLFGDEPLLHSLGVTLQVAAIAVVATTILGTLLGLGLARLRSGAAAGAADTMILLPMVTPEVVMGISLLLFFALLFNANGSIWQIAIAHIAFSISYVAIIVRARAVSLDPRMEEAARDLGASPAAAFFHVTLPLIAPAVAAGALIAFALSFDDLIITSFNAGVGSSTLPLHIYSRIRFGVTPEINAISTLIVGGTALLILVAMRFNARHGRARSAAAPPASPRS
ncbi:MAG: ABC transporter permease [Chloroflexi bacterium]|jgi:ABC-type spermidine/putrescine transport system permease subunit II|nr:ABC transporter permease [Chloroflexota bacterium]